MEFKTDNRWSSGGLDDKVPDTAVAVYGARWIDHDTVADIVPDRQGFAYNDPAERAKLIERLIEDEPHKHLPRERDTDVKAFDDDAFVVWMRRAGGYVYVCAWLEDF